MQFESPVSSLPKFNLPFNILHIILSTPVLLIVLIIFFVFYAILSGVLIYHWSAYGMKSSGILVAESLYLFVSLVLFGVASLAVYYF